VNLKGRILDVGTVRTFDRNDGSEGRVSNLAVGDPTGRIRVTLWDEKADLVDELTADQSVEIVDGYVKERDGSLELHVGSRGAVEPLDEEIEYVPETTDIGSVEIGQTVDISGGVIEDDGKRTFDRDDGSEGQVRNVRLKDETGDIRVALWGDKADKDIELADHVLVTDAEIQDGWQDELEASAGWQSTVSILESGVSTDKSDDEPTEATDREAEAAAAAGGLSAFEDGGSGGASESAATAETDANDDSESTKTTSDSGEIVEFTGTVVQTGNPVILDNGSETRSVDTGDSLRLGEEVTVRGPEMDGTISADELF